ncbi:MAG: ThiF family adenylyltransferase [Oscillatoriales cyanobacterium RM2_1_1]|nr:ThiF family adenylyltransferase [Oscillatoriales cyanobacterium SM2_3_0]NJO47923.1 ThiF family adenylyltransferase [Oscillatoriales cyanobacterium RM2_1_1]
MNNSPLCSQITLHVPPLMWEQFRHALQEAQAKNQEVIGFLFCKHHQISDQAVRYWPQAWVVPTVDCYESQSVNGLVLDQQFHLYLLETYLEEGLDMVHIHTHPGQEFPIFSTIDDCYESQYAKFLANRFNHQLHLISGIFDETFQKFQFRLWNQTGTAFQPVNFHPSWFALAASESSTVQETDPIFARQQIFGTTLQNQLSDLSVTLIGCGGIGAAFAELLGRLGVRRWTFIDPDHLEASNLNRMPGATWNMAEQHLPKVEYVKQLIENIYPTDSEITTIPTAIENIEASADCAASDLIVVATDNHHSRQVAQELALASIRPLIALGTHIEIKPDGLPRMFCRVTVPPLGGDWCLMCGNIINLQQAALESASPEIGNLATQAGYLKSVPDPAVFWLNSICASTGVGILQGMLSGFLSINAGLDWIYEFPESKWHKTDPDALTTSSCYFCGLGD